MRKLLLASAALVGGLAGTVSVAQAEALVNIQQPGVIPGALAPPGYGTATPGTTPQLPGTITVRIDARVIVNAYAGFDTGQKATVTPVAGGAPAPGVAGVSGGGTGLSLGSPAANTKIGAYGMGNYARIYPQFVGVAANGMKYGAFIEIRQDNASPAGGGANGSVSASNRSRAQLYFRREYVYAGTDQLGFFRIGSTDQPTSLMTTGTVENFDDGGWNGDTPSFMTGGSQPTWPFPDVGALYTTSKIVYVSPNVAGFDMGISFEPSTAAMNSGPGNCPYGVTANAGLVTTGIGGAAALGCDGASSTTSGDNGRRRNTLDAVLRYRGAFGPVGVAVTAGGMYGGRVLDNSTPAKVVQFNNLAVFDAGANLIFGGLTLGAHVDYGKFNGQWSLSPQHTTDSIAVIGGASYAIGPVIVGFHYFDYFSPGSKTGFTNPVVGNRHEFGVAVGTTYQLTQGVLLFASGLYGGRHEKGVDLLSGAVSAVGGPTVTTNNNTRAVAGLLGTMFKW